MFMTYTTQGEEYGAARIDITGEAHSTFVPWDASIQLCRDGDSPRFIQTAGGLLAVSHSECHRRSCHYCEARNASRRRKRLYLEMQNLALPLWRVDLTLDGAGRDFTASYITHSLARWSAGIKALRACSSVGTWFDNGITVIEATVAKAGFHVHCHSVWSHGKHRPVSIVRAACLQAGLGDDVHLSYLSGGLDCVKTAGYIAGYLTKHGGAGIPECCRPAYDAALKGRRLMQIWRR